MTMTELVANGWVPQYFDGESTTYRLHCRQHVLRFLRSGDLCVVERYRYGAIQDRESDTTGSYDAALAKLCARRHSSGVTLREWLRGLALTAGGG
jgi:hypothetical protein